MQGRLLGRELGAVARGDAEHADLLRREQIAKERQELERLDVNRAPGTGGSQPARPAERRLEERDDAENGEIGGNR